MPDRPNYHRRNFLSTLSLVMSRNLEESDPSDDTSAALERIRQRKLLGLRVPETPNTTADMHTNITTSPRRGDATEKKDNTSSSSPLFPVSGDRLTSPPSISPFAPSSRHRSGLDVPHESLPVTPSPSHTQNSSASSTLASKLRRRDLFYRAFTSRSLSPATPQDIWEEVSIGPSSDVGSLKENDDYDYDTQSLPGSKHMIFTSRPRDYADSFKSNDDYDFDTQSLPGSKEKGSFRRGLDRMMGKPRDDKALFKTSTRSSIDYVAKAENRRRSLQAYSPSIPSPLAFEGTRSFLGASPAEMKNPFSGMFGKSSTRIGDDVGPASSNGRPKSVQGHTPASSSPLGPPTTGGYSPLAPSSTYSVPGISPSTMGTQGSKRPTLAPDVSDRIARLRDLRSSSSQSRTASTSSTPTSLATQAPVPSSPIYTKPTEQNPWAGTPYTPSLLASPATQPPIPSSPFPIAHSSGQNLSPTPETLNLYGSGPPKNNLHGFHSHSLSGTSAEDMEYIEPSSVGAPNSAQTNNRVRPRSAFTSSEIFGKVPDRSEDPTWPVGLETPSPPAVEGPSLALSCIEPSKELNDGQTSPFMEASMSDGQILPPREVESAVENIETAAANEVSAQVPMLAAGGHVFASQDEGDPWQDVKAETTLSLVEPLTNISQQPTPPSTKVSFLPPETFISNAPTQASNPLFLFAASAILALGLSTTQALTFAFEQADEEVSERLLCEMLKGYLVGILVGLVVHMGVRGPMRLPGDALWLLSWAVGVVMRFARGIVRLAGQGYEAGIGDEKKD